MDEGSGLHNLHVPLPAHLYRRLRSESDRRKRPATELAREAIDQWLDKAQEAATHEAIARYAAEHGGTSADLDVDLEAAAIEQLASGASEAAVRRGEVYWAKLAPRSGSEQRGDRPVIVVSHDAFNQAPGWRSVIVVPVSTSAAQAGRGPTAIPLPKSAGGLGSQSVALCHEVTTLDRSKLTKRLGLLSEPHLAAVAEGLRIAQALG